MVNQKLEEEFTSMLIHSDTINAYSNMARNYIFTNSKYMLESQSKSKQKLKELREGDARKWITQLFTEGLDIPAPLYQINTVWLRRLDQIGYIYEENT